MRRIIVLLAMSCVVELGCADEMQPEVRIFNSEKIMTRQAVAPGIQQVSINKVSLLGMNIGQEAMLQLPDGSVDYVVYDSVETGGNGSQTWIGHFREYGEDYRVLMTFGKSGGAFGYIHDPKRTYLIETVQNQERLISPDIAGLQPAPIVVDDAIAPPRRPELASPLHENLQSLGLSPVPIPTIDLLVVYTPGMVSSYGANLGAKIDSIVSISNQAYKDSGIAMRLRLVGTRKVEYRDDNPNHQAMFELSGIGATIPTPLASVKSWRDSVGADLVAMLRPFLYPAQQSCGTAWIGGYGSAKTLNGWSDYGYSVTSVGASGNYYCNDISMTHEMGHNMGNMHDHRTVSRSSTPGATGVFDYSFGHGVDGAFSTIMAYASSYNNVYALSKFSNTHQDILCNNLPCGISGDDPRVSADNARSMNNIRSELASWRPTTIPIFPDVPLGGAYYPYVEAIFNSDITRGCGNNLFCPLDYVSREQMAAFIVRSKSGEPANGCVTAPFSDVPVSSPFCRHIKNLVELNVTKGCGNGIYCPTGYVSREQMAAFLVRAIEGEPPAGYCGGSSPFIDVSANNLYCSYIKRLVELNVTKGCGINKYCPSDLVTRDQMAAFLARAFLKMN